MAAWVKAPLLLLALGAGVLAGCGGGEDGTTTARVTRAEFVRKANAACANESANLAQEARQFEKRRAEADTKPAAYVDMVHFVFLPAVEEQINRIERLQPPPRDAARIDAMLDADRRAVDVVATTPRVPSIEAARPHFAEAEKLFRAYGLDACANGPGARPE